MAKPLPLVARVLSLTLVLGPWPGWAQTARVAVVAPAGQPVAPIVTAGPSVGGSVTVQLTTLRPVAGLGLAPNAVPAPGAGGPGESFRAQGAPRSLAQRAAQAIGLPRRAVAQSLAAAGPASETPAPSEVPEPFASEASVRGKKVVLVGTKSSKPFILEEAARVAKALGLELFLVDDPELRKNSRSLVDDAHFIAAPVNERDPATAGSIAELVAAHPEAGRAEVVASFLSSHAKVTAAITDRLGAAGIPGSAVAAADDKVESRRVLNQVSELEVPFRELSSADDARAAYRAMGGKVVIKSVRGENSRFLALGIDSEDAAAKAYAEMDEGLKAFAARPESKQTTFSSHPGIFMERMLEKVPGSEETSVEIIMQNGKRAFAMVSDTKSIGRRLELAAGSITFPSVQPEAVQQALIEASEKALAVLGITDGNARLDLIVTQDGPKIVEVNPFMGGANIFTAIKTLTGMSMVEQGLRALLGLKVDPGRAPDGVVDYRFWASKFTGTFVEATGLEDARASEGVVDVKLLVEPGDNTVAAQGQSYEEIGEIIGKGKDLNQAMARNIAALEKIKIKHSVVVEQGADHLQPRAPDEPAPDPAAPRPAAPKLWTKLVVGFLSTFVLVSTVVESTSLAVSQMTQPLTQGFWALSLLVSSSYIAYSLGSFLGGRWVDRFGIGRSYRTVLAVRAVIWTAIALLFNPVTGTVALPALVALFSLDYFAHSIGRVAEHKLQYELFKDAPTNSSRFGSLRDFIEYAAVFAGSVMGLAVAAFGFGAVIYPAPIAFAVAAAVALFLALPKASSQAPENVRWGAGFKAVFSNKGILTPLGGYILVNSFLYLLYYIIATAFGAYVAGDPQAASAVSGSLTGIYGIGALIGAAAMELVSRRIDKKTEGLAEPQKTEEGRRLYAASAARSLVWAAIGVLGTWAFTSQAILGTFVWPIFFVSPALFVIGLTAQMALIHLDTLMKDRIPKGDKELAGSILGAIRTLTYLSFVAVFLLWGGVFQAVGPEAFWWFAAFYSVAAAGYVWLARKLRPSPKA